MPRTTSPAPPMIACVRNWRHEKAITRAPPASGAPGAPVLALPHVGQHDVLEAELLHRPGGVEHRAVAPHQQGALAIGVALLNDLLPGRERCRVAARPDQPAVRRQQVVDLTGHLEPRIDEHDQVVAHPLQVGDEMRGEHDAHLPFGHELHQPLQELPAGQRVEAGHRLVEDEQLGPLGHRQGEGELRPLAARERAGRLVEIEIELRDALPGQCVVPARVHLPPEAEVVLDGEAGVGRGVLGDEAHARQLGGVGGRWAAEHGRRCRRSVRAGRRPGAAAWSCPLRWARRDRRRGRRGSGGRSR